MRSKGFADGGPACWIRVDYGRLTGLLFHNQIALSIGNGGRSCNGQSFGERADLASAGCELGQVDFGEDEFAARLDVGRVDRDGILFVVDKLSHGQIVRFILRQIQSRPALAFVRLSACWSGRFRRKLVRNDLLHGLEAKVFHGSIFNSHRNSIRTDVAVVSGHGAVGKAPFRPELVVRLVTKPAKIERDRYLRSFLHNLKKTTNRTAPLSPMIKVN